MPQTCVVRGCKNEGYPGCDTRFHTIPRPEARRKKWLENVPLKNKYYDGAKVCSDHFKHTDYDEGGIRLKPDAVPFFKDPVENVVIPIESNTMDLSHESNTSNPSSDSESNRSNDIACNNKEPDVLIPLHTSTKDSCIKAAKTPQDVVKTGQMQAVKFLVLEPIELDKRPSCEVVTHEYVCPRLASMVTQEETQMTNELTAKELKSDKLIQTNIKSPLEEELQRKNKVLAQRLLRQKKKVEKLEMLIRNLGAGVVTELTHKKIKSINRKVAKSQISRK